MKKCTKCQLEKELKDYSNSSRNKSGKRGQCKDCDFIDRSKKDKTKVLEYNKNYYLKNKDSLLDANKAYRLKNAIRIKNIKAERKDVSKIKVASSAYYLKNKELLNNKSKIYQEKNKDALREKSRKRNLERRKKDDVFKLSCNIRRLIQLSFKSKGICKNTKTEKILGCSVSYFKNHLESKFSEWMNWNNYGLFNNEFNHGWDIDHIIPISTAKTEYDLLKLNHYSNLQPLCSKYNRQVKKDKYE